MDVFIMYILMIVDLTWTVMHHEQAGEMNPLFSRLLLANEVLFVYLKIGLNSAAALAVIYMRPKHLILSRILTVFGIIIYAIVVYLHWFVDYSFQHAAELENSGLWGMIQGG
jgi:hypothetical protein